MSVRYHNFGGIIGWNLQKFFPSLSANSYLKLQFVMRRKLQRRYIEHFMDKDLSEPPMPLVVNLETINRCNSDCAFCTANRYAEKRPYRKMDDELFYSIIDQLAEWGYKGHLTLVRQLLTLEENLCLRNHILLIILHSTATMSPGSTRG